MASLAAGRQRLARLQVPDGGGVEVRRDIELARPEGQPLLVDLYLPAHPPSPPAGGLVPGGGWSAGDRRLCPDLRRWFAASGLAMASIGYRLSGQARFPAPLQDVRTAIRWLKDNAGTYGYDGGALGLWGASAGAHLAALAALSAGDPSEQVQAVAAADGERRGGPPVSFELIERFFDRHLRADPWG